MSPLAHQSLTLSNYVVIGRAGHDIPAAEALDHVAGYACFNDVSGRKLTIDVDDKAKEWLGAKGYDPAYGARPLKRVIQKYVQDPLAELILQGKIHEGENIKITADSNGLVINGQAVKQAA